MNPQLAQQMLLQQQLAQAQLGNLSQASQPGMVNVKPQMKGKKESDNEDSSSSSDSN